MTDETEHPDARLAASRYVVDRLTRENGEEPEADAGQPTPEQRDAIVEISIQQAMRRGDFDDLPGAGKPLTGLTGTHDPDWWIRRKIERENITGLGPPALTLRTENAQLDERLDSLFREGEVREVLEDFNRRVIEARRQLQGGPPVVTPTRDIDEELARWRARRDERRDAIVVEEPPPRRRRFRRGR